MSGNRETKYGWQPVKRLLRERGIKEVDVARSAGLTARQVVAPLYGHSLPRPKLQHWLLENVDPDYRNLWSPEVLAWIEDKSSTKPSRRYLELQDSTGQMWTFDLCSPQTSRWEADGHDPLDVQEIIERYGPIIGGFITDDDKVVIGRHPREGSQHQA